MKDLMRGLLWSVLTSQWFFRLDMALMTRRRWERRVQEVSARSGEFARMLAASATSGAN